MSVQCVNCHHFTLRDAGAMAKQGFGHCSLEKRRAVFESAVFERYCPKFERADADTAAKRRDWLDTEGRKFTEKVLGR